MMAPGIRPKTTLSVAAGVFASVLLLRLYVLARFSASAFLLPSQGDMHFYNAWALRILGGELTDYHAFYGLPLYPYLLAGLYKLFGYTPYLPAFLQACADSATAVILYRLGVQLFSVREGSQVAVGNGGLAERVWLTRGQSVGILAATGWAVYLPAQAYSAILMPTALSVFVFWFVVWQIVKWSEAPGAVVTFLFGLLIGFAAMGVATTLFLLPLFITALFWKWRPPGGSNLARAAFSAVIILAGVGLGTLPCWAHNYFVARDPVLLSAHSGVNFWIGNNPQANGYPRMPPGLHAGQEAMLQDSIATAEAAAGHPLTRAGVSAYWTAKANDYIRDNRGAWLKLLGTKVANFWNAFQYDDLSIITNLQLQGVLLPGLRFGIVAALALAGLVFATMQVPQSRWVLAAILLHMVSLLSVFVTERYRIAAVPGLLLFATFGIFHFWEILSRAQLLRVAAYLGLLVAATFTVSLRRGDPSLWALDPYNSGWQALQSKNFPLAKEKLELAYAYVPDNAEINFALGNLEIEQGNPAGAKPFYAATLRLDPTHEGAFNNLGVLAMEEKRWELAIKFFRGALRASQHDPKTHYLLGRAHFELGDYAAARSEAEIAIKLVPNQAEFIDLMKRITERQAAP